MEEALNEALLAAGERMAAALRLDLAQRGRCAELLVSVDGPCVKLRTSSREVFEEEFGSIRKPAIAAMEMAARAAVDDVLDVLRSRLMERLR